MGKRVEKGKTTRSSAKERNRAKLIIFLSNFEGAWPTRQDYSQTILGYKTDTQIYRTLSPQEITDIEAEAVEIIKAQSSRQRKELYQSLFEEGKAGNITAIKEFLDRTEGKVKEVKEHTGKDGGPIKVEHTSIDLTGAKEAYNAKK